MVVELKPELSANKVNLLHGMYIGVLKKSQCKNWSYKIEKLAVMIVQSMKLIFKCNKNSD